MPVLSAVPLSTTLTAQRLARARATLVRTVSADDLPCLGVAAAEQLGQGVRGALTGFKHSRRHRLLRLPSGIACLTVVCLANCAMLRHALGHSLPGGSRWWPGLRVACGRTTYRQVPSCPHSPGVVLKMDRSCIRDRPGVYRSAGWRPGCQASTDR